MALSKWLTVADSVSLSTVADKQPFITGYASLHNMAGIFSLQQTLLVFWIFWC